MNKYFEKQYTDDYQNDVLSNSKPSTTLAR